MSKLRVLWVPPHERELKSGGEYDVAQIREAGYEPEGMVAAGEAEWVSPPKPKAASKKKKA